MGMIVSICHCLPPLLPHSPLSHHLNPQTKDQEKFASENMRLCSLLLSSTLLASLLPSSLSQAALQFCDEPGLHYCMYQVKYWVVTVFSNGSGGLQKTPTAGQELLAGGISLQRPPVNGVACVCAAKTRVAIAGSGTPQKAAAGP